jgi:hypothetical protein
MKKFSRSIVGFTLVALLGVATTAQASDFTFNVPLNLQNLHTEVRSAYVDCRVFKTRGDYTAASVIGGGGRYKTDIPVDSNGNYRGTLTVGFDADSGKNASDARYYECDLNINGGNLTSYTTDRGAATVSRPGTTRSVRVTGEVPR